MDITPYRRKNLSTWFDGKPMPAKDKSYISQLIGEKAPFGEKAARRLERDYGMPTGYLDHPPTDASAAEVDGDEIHIPLLSGGGPSDAVINEATISIDWLRRHFSVTSPTNLRWLICSGDSMSPSIRLGDHVLVDTGVVYIQQEGIYVLARDGEVFIKRVQRDLAGDLLILNDNKAYETVKLPASEWERIQILGKAICAWNCNKL